MCRTLCSVPRPRCAHSSNRSWHSRSPKRLTSTLSTRSRARHPRRLTGSDLVQQVRHRLSWARALGSSPSLLVVSPDDAVSLDLAVDGDGRYLFPVVRGARGARCGRSGGRGRGRDRPPDAGRSAALGRALSRHRTRRAGPVHRAVQERVPDRSRGRGQRPRSGSWCARSQAASSSPPSERPGRLPGAVPLSPRSRAGQRRAVASALPRQVRARSVRPASSALQTRALWQFVFCPMGR
jgi:hypothetical protein